MRTISKLAAALVAASLLASPALADQTYSDVEASFVSDSMDLIVMRPMGLIALGIGSVLWLPAAAMTAAVQPSEIKKPTEALILRPYRYVFEEPIGEH